MTKHNISMRVICVDSPVSVSDDQVMRFGLQDKNKHLLQGNVTSTNELHFEFELDVTKHTDGIPSFTGIFAHGSRLERFLYLTFMNLQQESWTITRRIKIPLKTIVWEQVQTVLDNDGQLLQVMVSGRGSGTVPLLGDGWTVQKYEARDSDS